LFLRPEDCVSTADTAVHTEFVIVPVSVRKRELGAFTPGDGVFLRRQHPSPIAVSPNQLSDTKNPFAFAALREKRQLNFGTVTSLHSIG